MNLKKAFVVRSRLTRHYRELENDVEHLNYKVQEKDYDDYMSKVNVDAAYGQLIEAGEMLAKMNAAIDCANGNSKARLNLSRQEALRRRFIIAMRYKTEQNAFKPQEEEYDSYRYDSNGNKGTFITKVYKKTSDIDWMEESENIKREMIKLQDELDEINSEAIVEVPQEVLDYIAKM